MKKMKLSYLKIQSFVTTLKYTEKLKGGTDSESREEEPTMAECHSEGDCTAPVYCTIGTTRPSARCNKTTTGTGYYDTNQVECLG